MLRMWSKIFNEPYRNKIRQVLPTLFNMVELENKRGKKLGMEVGNARERVIIALFMYVYGKDNVGFPPTTSHEVDAIVNEHPVSIKTRLYNTEHNYSGVKACWTVDWEKVQQFVNEYIPRSDLLFINVVWGKKGGFYIVPQHMQKGIEFYFKMPKQGTNFRGVELSQKVLQAFLEHGDTQKIEIQWKRDSSLLSERALYLRWVDLWDTL